MAQGTLWFAGPCEDAEFGLALIEAGSEAEAESIAATDPAVQAGVFTSTLHPFRVSLWRDAPAPLPPSDSVSEGG